MHESASISTALDMQDSHVDRILSMKHMLPINAYMLIQSKPWGIEAI